MDSNIIQLKEKFQSIKAQGWIKSISNSNGSVGITFESLLGKKENNSVLPDYNGIELKCSSSSSFHPITLFSSNFDGPTKKETQRLANLYGKADSIIKDKNIIFASLSCNKDYLLNSNYYIRIKLDYDSKKLFFVVSDFDHNIIEEKCFIKFNTLNIHLITKLNYLAIITANKKYVNGSLFFNYYKLELYKLKTFADFIKAIEDDKIKINLILRINKSKSNYGKTDYKNVTFAIYKYDLKCIFNQY